MGCEAGEAGAEVDLGVESEGRRPKSEKKTIRIVSGYLHFSPDWYDITAMHEQELIQRITTDPAIFGGKPIVRGRRLAVEHVLSMLAAGDSGPDIIAAYPFLEPEDIRACLLCAPSKCLGTVDSL